MQNATAFWDRIADRYARRPVRDQDAYETTLARTASYLHPDQQVVELGCGTGTTALHLATGVAGVTASDLSPNMIRIAERKAAEAGTTNVRFVAADLFDPVLAGPPRDAVLAFNLLHLVRDLPAALGQVHTLVKPGGLFISKTPCVARRGAPLFYRVIRLILPVMQALGRAPFVNFMDPADLVGMIRDAGFTIVETGNYPDAPPNHFIVARRP